MSLAKQIASEQRAKSWKDRFDWWLEDNWTSRGKSIDFKKDRKYLEELYNCFDIQKIVVMSSSQAGKTENLISEAIYTVDQFNWNCIFFMPTEKNFGQFVSERVDEPITNNKHLAASVKQENKSGIKDKTKDSVAVKKLKGRLYFKGTQNTLSMKSTPADVVYVDELDEMDTDKVPLIQKRLHNSSIKKERWASTPTLPNLGIHAKYKESDQREYYVKCSHCKKFQTITFWDNVKWDEEEGNIINVRIECAYCHKEILTYQCDGEWRKNNPKSDIAGFYIHQLLSHTCDLKELIKQSKSPVESEVEQFYNQGLGLPFEPKGSKIIDSHFENCKGDYKIGEIKVEYKKDEKGNFVLDNRGDKIRIKEDIFAGFDIGKKIHYTVITETKVIDFGEVDHYFKEEDDPDNSAQEIIEKYDVAQFGVDALPETRNSVELCHLFPGKGLYVYYGLTKPKKDEYEQKEGLFKWIEVEENTDKTETNRTVSLDYTMALIRARGIQVPFDYRNYPEFADHIKNLIRVVREDNAKNKKATYEEIGPDHIAHAFNYAHIAREFYIGDVGFEFI